MEPLPKSAREFVGEPGDLIRSLDFASTEVKRALPAFVLEGVLVAGIVWFVRTMVSADPGSHPHFFWGVVLPYYTILFVCNTLRCAEWVTRIRKAIREQERALYGMQLMASEEPLALCQRYLASYG